MFYFQTQLKLETNTNVSNVQDNTICTTNYSNDLLILILNDPYNLYKYIQKGRNAHMEKVKHERN